MHNFFTHLFLLHVEWWHHSAETTRAPTVSARDVTSGTHVGKRDRLRLCTWRIFMAPKRSVSLKLRYCAWNMTQTHTPANSIPNKNFLSALQRSQQASKFCWVCAARDGQVCRMWRAEKSLMCARDGRASKIWWVFLNFFYVKMSPPVRRIHWCDLFF